MIRKKEKYPENVLSFPLLMGLYT